MLINLSLTILLAVLVQGSFASYPDQGARAGDIRAGNIHDGSMPLKDPRAKGCPASLFEKSQNRKNEGTFARDTQTGCAGRQLPHDAPENLITRMPLEPTPEQSGCQILIFVSFSMPESSLKSLSQEAKDDSECPCRPTLAMRGLHLDSFVKTAEKLKDLGVSVDINPELFEAHQITAVPTFVLIKDGKPLHRLRGNVTLAFAAKTFAKQGEQADDGGTP